jgi:hypothetical protein
MEAMSLRNVGSLSRATWPYIPEDSTLIIRQITQIIHIRNFTQTGQINWKAHLRSIKYKGIFDSKTY